MLGAFFSSRQGSTVTSTKAGTLSAPFLSVVPRADRVRETDLPVQAKGDGQEGGGLSAGVCRRDRRTLTAAEKGTQLRSRLARVLNVPQRVRLRLLPRLRPRWMTFLSSLKLHVFSLQREREQTLKLLNTRNVRVKS